eukprot:TRINITY_DN20631_c0_g1_i1.p1 TRINITY_DN20631_c0_g1~~TRINITY_DN20631_c0_g1_i1.p1  ORF type:complete len:535 (+),score=170.51 TRINITY_DN20631_c0_g1_i1:76-1680(+)
MRPVHVLRAAAAVAAAGLCALLAGGSTLVHLPSPEPEPEPEPPPATLAPAGPEPQCVYAELREETGRGTKKRRSWPALRVPWRAAAGCRQPVGPYSRSCSCDQPSPPACVLSCVCAPKQGGTSCRLGRCVGELCPYVVLNNIMGELAREDAAPCSGPEQPPAERRAQPSGGAGSGWDPRADGDTESTLAVVVFAYRRPERLRGLLRSVAAALPPSPRSRVIVSEDRGDAPAGIPAVAADHGAVLLVHRRDDSRPPGDARWTQQRAVYYAIARHYKWALDRVLSEGPYSRAVVLEEDMEVAPDFFEYVLAASPLLSAGLMCVSGWNDNGRAAIADDPSAVYLTDFFPGLGWMLSRELWAELSPVWPESDWDDWLRRPEVSRGRPCLRPEVSRTRVHCGGSGDADAASLGLFCCHIRSTRVSTVKRRWSTAALADRVRGYDGWLRGVLLNGTVVDRPSGIKAAPVGGEVVVSYDGAEDFRRKAVFFGLMSDLRDGVAAPRTGYRGVVTFRWHGRRLHLAPVQRWYGGVPSGGGRGR